MLQTAPGLAGILMLYVFLVVAVQLGQLVPRRGIV